MKPRPAANDDRAVAVSLRPSQAAGLGNIFAVAGSLVWVGLGVLLIVLSEGDGLLGFLATAPGLVALVALVVPPLAFFTIAALIGRAAEMTVAAAEMTEIARKLTVPEIKATEGVVNIGQAIRREVAAMGDGIERALARATELEVLVQREVSALERSYGDHEVKIRNLFEELVNERQMLAAHGDRLRDEIGEAKRDLAEQIKVFTEQFRTEVNDTSSVLSHSVNHETDRLVSALDESGQALIGVLNERGEAYVERLSARSLDVEERLVTSGNEIVARFEQSTGAAARQLDESGEALASTVAVQAASAGAARKTATVGGVGCVLAAAGVAGAISLTGDGTSDKAGPSALTLQVPSSGVAGSCIQFDVAFLRDMPVAFAGTVTAVTDSAVSLDVDRWYKGGTADTVSVEVPDGQSSAALDGVDFVDGEQYLVTATDGTVNGCGFSGPATPELKKAYAEAFGG
jgi:hypothetical protein